MAHRQAMMKFMDATLVADVKIDNVAEWCRLNGVNPRTFYRHRARVAAEGRWQPQSRRPHHSPTATDEAVVAEVLRLRQMLGPDNGADSILTELVESARIESARIESARIESGTAQDWAARGLTVPARATINRILDRHGLLDKNPAKRPRSSWRSFSFARPRDCYQIDGTRHLLADGTPAVAIDVIDDCSRVWVAAHACPAETTDAALAALAAAEADWGLPGLVLADNGSAFAHPRRDLDKTLTSRFSRALAERGTRVIHSSPYHPQTCGKCERLHATAAKLLAHFYPNPPADLAELQTRLDHVRGHYNTVRRHSSIGRVPPRQAWQTAAAHGGPADLPRQTDATVHILAVVANGTIKLGNHILSVGARHKGTTVTVLRNGDHVTVYAPHGEPLGQLTIRPDRLYQGQLHPAA